jgi:hypothetical protein
VISSLDGDSGRLYRSILQTWRQLDGIQIYVFPKYFQSLDRRLKNNVILLGVKSSSRLGKDEIERKARRLKRSGKVRADYFVLHAEHYAEGEHDRPLDEQVLTDDFAPVELMAIN